jgi:hypothetical protein
VRRFHSPSRTFRCGLELDDIPEWYGGQDVALLVCDFKRPAVDFLFPDYEVGNHLASGSSCFLLGLLERSQIDAIFVEIIAVVGTQIEEEFHRLVQFVYALYGERPSPAQVPDALRANRVRTSVGRESSDQPRDCNGMPHGFSRISSEKAVISGKLRGSHISVFCYLSRVLLGSERMTSLVPDGFYWAKSEEHEAGRLTVVRVSTVFGADPEYWTVVVPGSDQHHMIDDFQILAPVEPPAAYSLRQAAE